MTPNEIARLNTERHPPQDHVSHPQDEDLLHLENRLRIKKNAILEYNRRYATVEREVEHLQIELTHANERAQDLRGEVHHLEILAQKNKASALSAGEHLREKDMELQKYNKENARIEQEIERLRVQITAKERELADRKTAHADLAKEKEEFRRQNEMESFGASAESGHVREKSLEVMRFEQEAVRTEHSIARKMHELEEIKKEIAFTTQEITELEVALHRG